MAEKRDEVLFIESLIENVRPFGLYQKGYMVLLQMQAVFICCCTLFISFALLEPDIICLDENGISLNETSKCFASKNCTNWTLVYKDGFESLRAEYPELIVSKCDSRVDPILSLMSAKELTFGILSMFTGVLPDLFGRKPMLLLTTFLTAFSALGCAFSRKFFGHFVPFWFLMAFGFAIHGTATSSLGSEYTLGKYRLSVNAAITWAVAFPLLGLLAYLTKSYRMLLVIGGCLGVPVFAGFAFYSESPRWLLVRRQYDKAAVALNRMAWVNGAKVHYDGDYLRRELANCESHISAPTEGYLLSWFRDLKTIGPALKNRRLLTFLFFISWHYLIAGAIGINFVINAGDFENLNSYWSLALVGLFRIWTPFAIIGTDLYVPKFRRRTFVMISFALTIIPLAIAMVCSIAANYEADDEVRGRLQQALAMCAIFSTAMSFGLLFFAVMQITIEVFPTVTRSGAMSVISIANTIASALGPQVTLLNNVWKPLQFVLATVCFIISFAMAFVMLPETKDKPLPDRLEDIELVLKRKPKSGAKQNVSSV